MNSPSIVVGNQALRCSASVSARQTFSRRMRELPVEPDSDGPLPRSSSRSPRTLGHRESSVYRSHLQSRPDAPPARPAAPPTTAGRAAATHPRGQRLGRAVHPPLRVRPDRPGPRRAAPAGAGTRPAGSWPVASTRGTDRPLTRQQQVEDRRRSARRSLRTSTA